MSAPEPTPVQEIRLVNAHIKAIVEKETAGKSLTISGLVRRAFRSDRGHLYFDLVDGEHSIACILRESIRGSLGFTPENGMELELLGTILVYEKQATVQIDVQQARLIERNIVKNFQNNEAILSKRGLWPKAKRPLPAKITKIALVTSKHSEAQYDFETNYLNASGTAQLKRVDVRIQGQYAAKEIADAIRRLNQEAEVDVIVLTRGGGRVADLAVFDDLLIAEAICQSTIPIVTGIGHERDETFADRVADASVSTPTAAAVLLATHKPAPKSCLGRSAAVLLLTATALLLISLL